MATKIILVTGANTGLGLEIVKALCGSIAQYEILLGGRSLDKAKAAVSEIVTSFPSAEGRVTAIQVDVEDDGSIAAAFDTVKNKHGRLDVLVLHRKGLTDIVKPNKGALLIRDLLVI